MQNNILRILLISIITLFTIPSYAAVNLSPDHNNLNFLVFSDIHLDLTKKTPMEINPNTNSPANDSDQDTFLQIIQKIHDAIQFGTIKKPRFILLLGDHPGHDRLTTPVHDDEKFVMKTFKDLFPDTPILSVFGNNDSLEKIYGAFYFNEASGAHSPYEIAIEAGWEKDGFLSTGVLCQKNQPTYPCLDNEDKINGYYSAHLANNLRLITINSVMFSASSQNTTPQSKSDEQMAWIASQLEEATKLGESVLIASHIPLSSNVFDNSPFLRNTDRSKLLELLSRYKNNIIGILSGHTHMEELEVLQDTAHNTVGGVIFTAGMSTAHGNAPSVKTFFLNHNFKKWEITNYKTYSMIGNFSLNEIYDFRDTYCPKNIKSDNIFECFNGANFLDNFKRYFSAGNPNYAGPVNYPEAIYITLPDVPHPTPDVNPSSNSNGSSDIYYGIGAAAAIGAAALILNTPSSSKDDNPEK